LPFLIYTGLGKVSGSCAAGFKVTKPESPTVLVTMMEALLRGPNDDACSLSVRLGDVSTLLKSPVTIPVQSMRAAN